MLARAWCLYCKGLVQTKWARGRVGALGSGFPSGSVEKNPPANAGDTSLIPSPGTKPMHCKPSLCCKAQELQWLNPGAAATEAGRPRACAQQQEMLLQ